jgi:hypothetical protein
MMRSRSSQSLVWGGTGVTSGLTPKGALDLMYDFSQMFDVLAEQHGISSVFRHGNLVSEINFLIFKIVIINDFQYVVL